MISEDDKRTLKPLAAWCDSHPDQNVTPAILESLFGVPESTARSWAGKSLPEKRDGAGYAWGTEFMPGWLAVHGGTLATNIRSIRTLHSLRELRDSL